MTVIFNENTFTFEKEKLFSRRQLKLWTAFCPQLAQTDSES